MIPVDYEERVYAGVLGKMIGVYLGRPFEGWSYEQIIEKLGEIRYYVHEKLNKRLVVTDDDLAGTFTFLTALSEHGFQHDLTPAQIGQTWLNTIVEGRTILWWGGVGNSTEHTAYVRLKSGIPAPMSGSAKLNGKVISEQIGAQIFIDGWGMVAPGNPELAADLARRAASVSHDGEAIYAAQVIAALESQAFVEPGLERLLDTAIRLIPHDSLIYRLIEDLREQREAESDWRSTRAWLAGRYGYDQYPGNCHVIPNHGLIILSLLYGEDNFQKSLSIVNTSGWDTDCNSGNVGCLLGIKNGLAGIDQGSDWRGPIADRLFLPSANGGQTITDSVRVTYSIINSCKALEGQPLVFPKSGARFHFELPGSVQGFRVENLPTAKGRLKLTNTAGHSQTGRRSLALAYQDLAPGEKARAGTAVFILPEDLDMPGYTLLASPTLYSGQTVEAGFWADELNQGSTECRLFCRSYGAEDTLQITTGPEVRLQPGETRQVKWQVNSPLPATIAEIGVEIGSGETGSGTIYLDYITWTGTPEVDLTPPPNSGAIWRRTWIEAVDRFYNHAPGSFKLIQNRGTGLLLQGTQEWTDYKFKADITPELISSAGIAVRVQGLRRYYALVFRSYHKACLIKMLDDETIIQERSYAWEFFRKLELSIQVCGNQLRGWIDGQLMFDFVDEGAELKTGGIALLVADGCLSCDHVSVKPLVEPG